MLSTDVEINFIKITYNDRSQLSVVPVIIFFIEFTCQENEEKMSLVRKCQQMGLKGPLICLCNWKIVPVFCFLVNCPKVSVSGPTRKKKVFGSYFLYFPWMLSHFFNV